jgi:hypothetical protein
MVRVPDDLVSMQNDDFESLNASATSATRALNCR